MSDSTTSSPNTSAPWLHQSDDSAAKSGSPAQLISRLDDCRGQLANFSDGMSRELNDILSILSPEHGDHNPHAQAAPIAGAVEAVPFASSEIRPPDLPSDVTHVDEPAPRASELDQPRTVGDDQSRLAALKERIAARLRNETDSTEFALQQGGDQ